jgi:polyhydroxyalkanoate synthase
MSDTVDSFLETALDSLRNSVDPFGILSSLLRVQQAWLRHPKALFSEFGKLGGELWSLQQQSFQRMLGLASEDAFPAAERDERFQAEIWTENPYLDTVKEYYLAYTRWLEDAVFSTPELPEKERKRAAFWLRQGLNALAPTNYFWTNPYAVQRYVESGGHSLLGGLTNVLKDLETSDLRMVDKEAFAVGRNLATTTGQVVFRNELLELIQYAPDSEQVRAVPILIVAPWINKYYILDLNEKKSLVRHLVKQGFTVFVTSWRNPTTEMRTTTFDDYMLKGLLPAVEAVRSICAVPQIHAVGYCIGGTLLASLLAWLAVDEGYKDKHPIAHWTLFASLVDFADAGDIEVFIDEHSVASIEQMMAMRGYLDGAELAMAFRMLRSNSLIWHYYVHHYLYGEEPPQFDVLYWNMDSTRLPEAMHSFYLREFYLQNRLAQPGAVTLGGHPIDLGRITQPLYAVGAEQDHITPWKETFKTCNLVKGPVRYVLATSGHIVGIINPPVDPPKRRYWVGDASGHTDPMAWQEAMKKEPGSWWQDWWEWLGQQCGPLQGPRTMGNKSYPALDPAPGPYVFER